MAKTNEELERAVNDLRANVEGIRLQLAAQVELEKLRAKNKLLKHHRDRAWEAGELFALAMGIIRVQVENRKGRRIPVLILNLLLGFELLMERWKEDKGYSGDSPFPNILTDLITKFPDLRKQIDQVAKTLRTRSPEE